MVCPLLRFEATDAALPTAWDVLVFTSANAVAFWSGPFEGVLAAVGPKTAALLPRVDVMPTTALGSALVAALAEVGVRGRRVCYPRAEEVPPDFERALEDEGAIVLGVPVYRTVPTSPRLPDHDRVALASGSAARNYARLGGKAPCVCIGPSTAAVALECGLTVAAVASPHTSEGLAAACVSDTRPR